MDRRSYLATAVATLAGLAGCMNSNTTSQPTNTAATPPTTDTTTAEITTSPQTETATETEAATETTSQAQPDAATAIKRARNALGNALHEYTGSEDPDITTVAATSTSFKQQPVNTALATAQDALTTAQEADATDEQAQTIRKLTGVHSFLSHSTTAQTHLITAYTTLKTARTNLQNENPRKAQSTSLSMRSAVTSALNPVSALQRERESSDATALGGLSESEYARKITQLADERQALNDTEGLVGKVIRGMRALVAAREYYQLESYSDAVPKADRAERILSEAGDELSLHSAGVSSSVSNEVSALARTASSKADAAAAVREKSSSKANDE
ncbi:hypothetical protein [Halobacterium noricense]|uniref:hypothetical protein n=1 Tax=Halobacterium noricense TaxID=223182 RepID=UPI001E381A17|nr:hypothetical protein [Halobacterium noricense]UHH26659.1 hypothetical protein LT974_06930 [Halobacterium noricense]